MLFHPAPMRPENVYWSQAGHPKACSILYAIHGQFRAQVEARLSGFDAPLYHSQHSAHNLETVKVPLRCMEDQWIHSHSESMPLTQVCSSMKRESYRAEEPGRKNVALGRRTQCTSCVRQRRQEGPSSSHLTCFALHR